MMSELRQKTMETYKMEDFILSMGTSADFEDAVRFVYIIIF